MNQSVSTSLKQDAPRKRVLIVAYALSPVLGSEYRSAWELVKQISKHHNVTVVFGDSDSLMGSFEHFDCYAAANEISFRAIKVEASKHQMMLANRMRSMPWALAFPALLRIWHKSAFEIAKRLHDEEPFDVAHQLGPIGFRNPGYLWKLDCHTYWGPIGGAQYINTKMIKNKNNFYFAESIIRNLSVKIQSLSPYIKKAARGFDRVSFATIENADYFAKNYQRTGPIVSDQGLFEVAGATLAKGRGDTISVTWAGSLTPRKNIDLLIDIVKKSTTNVQFNILGGGSREPDICALAAEFPNVNYRGSLPRTEVMQVLAESDAILLTSLSEANTAILFEAIENDCIPIVPRINGFVSVLNDDVAYLIDQGDYEGAISQTLDAFACLADHDTRAKLRSGLQTHKSNLTWEALTAAHLSQYE
jgi:glycosyltransferase involved in cell wall biosynthesis